MKRKEKEASFKIPFISPHLVHWRETSIRLLFSKGHPLAIARSTNNINRRDQVSGNEKFGFQTQL